MLPQLPTDNLYKFMAISGLTAAITSIVLYVQGSLYVINDLNSADRMVTAADDALLEIAKLGIGEAIVDVQLKTAEGKSKQRLNKIKVALPNGANPPKSEIDFKPDASIGLIEANKQIAKALERIDAGLNGYKSLCNEVIWSLDPSLFKKLATDDRHKYSLMEALSLNEDELLSLSDEKIRLAVNNLVNKHRELRKPLDEAAFIGMKSSMMLGFSTVAALTLGILFFVGLSLASIGFTLWYTRVQVPQDRLTAKVETPKKLVYIAGPRPRLRSTY